MTFDYVIVGAGSAGATLAARLTENPNTRVALLEAGKKDRHPLIHIPFGLALMSRIRSLNWNYQTAPQSQLNQRSLYWPRGKTLGGSSSVNAMCYIRGDKQDYDDWAANGATGWDWASVLPYFKKSEANQWGADEFHGDSGPLSVTDLRYISPMTERFLAAGDTLGLPKRKDFNRIEREGLGLYQVTQKNGQRCSTAKGYLTDARQRPNLTLLTDCLAEKVQVTNGRATGVHVRHKGLRKVIEASKEVILSGGAINSPQLLMLSGIGCQKALTQLGIEVHSDVPAVGQNLQDHLDVIIQHRGPAPGSYAMDVRELPRYIKAGVRYLFKRDEMLSSNIAEGAGFLKSTETASRPDLQLHFLPAILEDHGRRLVAGYGFGLHLCQLYPHSRGQITLRSANPADAPCIDPNYLSDQRDIDTLLAAIRVGRNILAAAPLAELNSREVLPGEDKQSDDELLSFIRQHAESIYHPIGTCKMGDPAQPDVVVDPQLKVKGVEGLRVVDASVMPSLIGGNTNAPTIMIAERIADLIKQQQ